MPDARGEGRHVPHRRDRTDRSYARTIGFTLLGTLVPGVGLLAAGRRRLGAVIVALTLILFGILAWFAFQDPQALLHLSVQPDKLVWTSILLAVIAVAWVAVIVCSHRSLRPPSASGMQRAIGSGLVCVLALVVMLPLLVGSRYSMVQRDLVQSVFVPDTDRSATRPKHVTPDSDDPWGDKERVNVLLLGGDGGTDRIGVRPDSILLASIDTETGNTVLFSLPRNLQKVPFPEDSKLAEVYPNGRFQGPGDPLEWMLNAMYRNVPREHPGLLKTDHPGADVMKLAVGASLGLDVDYFALVNLRGFRKLINALGGVTVNVNKRVPIGGSVDSGTPPSGWIEPGPHKHLDGFHALWFARGRWGSDDYDRMRRQRCVMKAIIDQANPARMIRRYEAIAKTSKDIVQTDIPQPLLPAFVDLSMKVKGGSLTSVVFDDTVIEPSDPDYDLIRSKVAESIAASEETGSDEGSEDASEDGSTASPSPSESQESTGSQEEHADQPDPADKLKNRCAYHPDAAAQ